MNVLGEDKSFGIMKDMKDTEVRRLLNVMGKMQRAPITLINSVLREFLYKISEQEEIIFEGDMSSPEVISKGLGEERARQIFGRIKNLDLVNRKHLTALEEVDVSVLVEFLVEEHPQTIALIMVHLDMDKQIALIKQLPDTLRTEVIMRMAGLAYVAPDKVEELDEVLKKELGVLGKSKRGQLGGVTTIAEMINSLDTKTMNSILSRMQDKDPLLAEEIRQHIFTFTDIVQIDDRGIQLIMREVPNEKLMLALKSAPEELRQKIYSAMSERAALMLQEDLEALGPQKVSDIEKAQREIVKIIRRLEEEGKVVIGVGEEDEVVP